jgi:molybdopterin-containing oxidoreductase family membrane subunit
LKDFSTPVGFAAFLWRIGLTTATGSIFGFLVARVGYNSALMAPMFIVMSFAYGLAVFLMVQTAMYKWNQLALDDRILGRMKNLLGIFIAAALYFNVVFHLTNMYFAKQWAYEQFILLDGGIYTLIFWGGQILIGCILPLALLFSPGARQSTGKVLVASMMVVLGGVSQMYVTIVGGQAFPLVMFPGYQESSSFYDGQIHAYTPSIWEILLGMGGVGIAFFLTVAAVRVFKFLPQDDFKSLESKDA